MQRRIITAIVLVLLCVASLAFFEQIAKADVIDDLKKKIEDRGLTIKELEAEIEKYRKDLTITNAEAKSLQSTIKILDTTNKKLQTDLTVTEKKIDYTTLTIQKLELDIGAKTSAIERQRLAVSESIRQINREEHQSIIEGLLAHERLSSFWDSVESLRQFQGRVQIQIDDFRTAKKDLETTRYEKEEQKDTLIDLKGELADKKKVVEYSKNEKQKLLTSTKEKESSYKKLLADAVAKKEAFERELLKFESELKLQIDPSSIPRSGSGVLRWPLDQIKVTQEFGDTEFSRTHTQVYNGKGHNGVDFRAAIGTQIKSARQGIIKGVGDTDTVCPRASYGKWVLVEHDNGLSTLYAHLSVIKVSPGQTVEAGGILGYSGNTGYSTGPHLHFTVYATQGVRVTALKSRACRGTY